MATQSRSATQSSASVGGSVQGIVSDVRDHGREAIEGVADVRDIMQVAIERSLKKRPYTTLALSLGLGFLLGAMWAR